MCSVRETYCRSFFICDMLTQFQQGGLGFSSETDVSKALFVPQA